MTATKDIKPAKLCFEHIGGKLGELLLETFIEKKWIATENPPAGASVSLVHQFMPISKTAFKKLLVFR